VVDACFALHRRSHWEWSGVEKFGDVEFMSCRTKLVPMSICIDVFYIQSFRSRGLCHANNKSSPNKASSILAVRHDFTGEE
jgi:hypothetical protein